MKRPTPGWTFFALALVALPFAAPLHAAQINPAASTTDQASPASLPEAEPPHFTKVIEDLPLMPGLQLVEDEDVLFASPNAGRIAETNAIGPVDIDDVYKFYKRSLPHLGWKTVDSRTYQREGEQLRIEAHANAKITIVKFTVKPIAATR
jgi:hypothetical protein